jgi:hypothetical protein
MGYWLILQVGAVRQPVSGGIALVMYRSVFLFVILSSASAYLRERTSGARPIVVKVLYLTGAYGLPSIALFTAVTKGVILQMPEVIGLLALSSASASYSGRLIRSTTTDVAVRCDYRRGG